MAYYISPRFLDKISIHITKNYLDLPGVKVPLILGVHGRKGEGKSFQCELAFERMGIEVVHMSAGELESPDAGDPARLIRLRYREAAELSRVRGKMAALMINDIDAGMGRVDQFTQYTVNTQLVAGTLMNIADNPTNVQLPGSYDAEPVQRIPIIVTGNDFSTLYAPLVRDGRMEKFYWEPDRDDRIGIVGGIFSKDSVSRSDIEKLVDTFPQQSIDFFGALHSRLYDEQIRQFIHQIGIERISQRVVNSTEKPPEFHKPDFSIGHLIDMGQAMVREQQQIQELRLVNEYNTAAGNRKLGSERVPVEAVREPGIGNRESGIGGQPANGYAEPPTQPSYKSSHNPSNGRSTASSLPSEAAQTLRNFLNQGYRVGIEYVDQRRFRTNSWQCYAIVQGNEAEALSQLQACLNEHETDYVRLVAINSTDRHRASETVVHRPVSRAI
ncbi:MAG TPA: ribulose bisphosphate carboxylase small subunit [Allocoleopsis sp.]